MDAMEQMLQYQIVERGVKEPVVLDAMRQVPREVFVPSELRDEAYADEALPIGRGQTISQPFIVALMTEALEVASDHRVLEIGTGSGYQTAILARLAKWVYTIDRIGELVQEARDTLQSLQIRNVSYRVGDGTLGWPEEALFERILVTAAGPRVPEELLRSQLAEGGIAVLPAGNASWQDLLQIRRKGKRFVQQSLGACQFVRLIGKEGWQA
jgi:protein-L-isoaspartate(D-aspartate) O-methyltransferase